MSHAPPGSRQKLGAQKSLDPVRPSTLSAGPSACQVFRSEDLNMSNAPCVAAE